jgi:hypothetical protein
MTRAIYGSANDSLVESATHNDHTDDGVYLDSPLPSLLSSEPITVMSTDHEQTQEDLPVLAIILHLGHDAEPLPELSTSSWLTKYSLPKAHGQCPPSTSALFGRPPRVHRHKYLFIPSSHECVLFLHGVESSD